jgi:hypothetical protein
VLAQTARDLVGNWTLVSAVAVAEDGTRTDRFGANPQGLYRFDDNGRFAIVAGRSGLPKSAADNRELVAAAETKAVAQGGIALSGTYAVADNVVTLKVEAGTRPNWIGTDQRRNITAYGGDALKWIAPAESGGTIEVALRRIAERTAAVATPAPAPQAAPSLPAPTPSHLNRFVPTAEERMIAFYTSLFPDCSPRGPTVGRITTKPQHGNVRFDQGESFVFYNANSPMASCSNKKVPGLLINYKSGDGYVGEDTAVLLLIFPDGSAAQVDVLFLVR